MKNNELKIEKLNNYYIDNFDMVTLTTTAPHLMKITYVRNVNTECPIVNIDKDTYMVKSTEKIKQKKHTEKRINNKASLRKTRQNIINYINTNITDIKNTKFITLTYQEDMTDTKQLDKNLNLFIKNFNYRYNTNKNIKVCVPQLRGAYHIHIIFIFDEVAPYTTVEELKQLWSYGNIKIQTIYGNIDNLGVYLSSHLCDLPLEDMEKYNISYDKRDIKEVWEINGKRLDKPKYFVKNGIANLIPTGFRILRLSRNLKKPTKEKMQYHEARKKVDYSRPTFTSAFSITKDDDDSGFSNIIAYEHYNTKKLFTKGTPTYKDLEAINLFETVEAYHKELEKSDADDFFDNY